MTYSITITKKGQITIPKPLREFLKLEEGKKLLIELEKKAKEIKIKPVHDFLEIAKKIKVKKKINPVKAREYMEKFYERV